jgi:AP-1 complex subunit gamma-1
LSDGNETNQYLTWYIFVFTPSLYGNTGYPTHFGQLECMKLTASPHFPEKRIGYLGMMLLLTEDTDVLMLSTNSLKNDLNSENRFVAGLALCAIGNLATSDMSRDLAPEVDKHLKSNNPYLRKKACLAMSRCLSRCPEMIEDFVDRVSLLLKDKSHGVLITVVQLMTQILLIDNQTAAEEGYEDLSQTPCRKAFLQLVPILVKLLRNLLSQGYSPDHDVGGISDPFLQVQLLTVLRLLGTGNLEASEEMNDVLAQVATNTETTKNAGNAILYECVQTIMAVESDDSLRILAVNILGRFLLNRDNNIRYVALNTLAKCIVEQNNRGDGAVETANSAATALQRHRTTVVDCLKDPDVSIRQRALELIYHLVNDENVEDLTAELLNYLVLCPREHKSDICDRILRVVDRFSPDDRWRIDTLITMLTISGKETSRDVRSATIAYISRAPQDIQTYATHKLIKAIRDDDGNQSGLLIVGIWCIGEYGDFVLQPYTYIPPSSSGAMNEVADAVNGTSPSTISYLGLDPSSVVRIVEQVITRNSCPLEIKERCLTCLAKLSDRYANDSDTAALQKIEEILRNNKRSHTLEIQLRACEYDALLMASKGILPTTTKTGEDLFGTAENSTVSPTVMNAAKDALARMPIVDISVLQKKKQASDSFYDDAGNGATTKPSIIPDQKISGDLLDLADIFGSGESAPVPTQSGAAIVPSNDLDLLSDIFSAPPVSVPTLPSGGGFDPFSGMATPVQPSTIQINPMDLFGAPPVQSLPPSGTSDFFGTSSTLPLGTPAAVMTSPLAPSTFSVPTPLSLAPAVQSSPAESVRVHAFSHQGLSVDFECMKPDTWNKQKSTLVATFLNATDAPIYGLSMQCAVPKYVTMDMQPPTSTTVPQSGGNTKPVTQTITVNNSMLGTKNLMLKLKVGFTLKGNKIEHLVTASGFPPGLY